MPVFVTPSGNSWKVQCLSCGKTTIARTKADANRQAGKHQRKCK